MFTDYHAIELKVILENDIHPLIYIKKLYFGIAPILEKK